MKNSTRNFVKIIREICDEEKIDFKSFSYDWIFQLHTDKSSNYIIGYQFGLDVASVHSICCDKSAASEIMSSLGIPNIEHYFFMSPVNQKYVSEEGNWIDLMKKLEKYKQLVCKPNEGSGGNLVFRVSNQYELEDAVYKIFQKSRSMAVSKYYDISNEYRAIVLDGMIKLIYLKERPYVVGDGTSTIRSLICNYCLLNKDSNISNVNISDKDMARVLGNEEHFELNWKHNLGQGSKAIILHDRNVINAIKEIVSMVVNNINIRFASIDVVECDNEYKVLEINSGVMMEHFSKQDDVSYGIAKEIYKEAVLKMLER